MRWLGCLGLGAIIGSASAAPAAEPPVAPSTTDPRIPIVCAMVRPGSATPLHEREKVANGIVYEERVTPDQTRLELVWRHVGVVGRSGHALVPVDLEACVPLLADEEGAVFGCRHQEAREGAVPERRLVRLRSGKPPLRLAAAQSLPGDVHLHPLSQGRLLAWIDRAQNPGPQDSAEEVTAAELDPKGAVLHYAIISPPYLRRWVAGQVYLLLQQPPVGSSGSSTYWRAQWDDTGHRVDLRPEPLRGRLHPCQGQAKPSETAVARLTFPKREPTTALVNLARDASGACVRAVSSDSGDGDVVDLRAEAGRLRGHVWLIDGGDRPHARGGTRPAAARIVPAEVTCEVRAPG